MNPEKIVEVLSPIIGLYIDLALYDSETNRELHHGAFVVKDVRVLSEDEREDPDTDIIFENTLETNPHPNGIVIASGEIIDVTNEDGCFLVMGKSCYLVLTPKVR